MNTVNRFGRRQKVATLLLLLSLPMGCVTTRSLDVNTGEEGLTASISSGDVVKLTTRSGEQYVIEVSAITADEISGEGRVFRLEDIEKIEVREATPAGKAVAGGAVFVGTIAVYALVFAFIGLFVVMGL